MFLQGYSQKLAIGGERLLPQVLTYGVPKGQFSPVLFNIYIHHLAEIIRRLGVGCHKFVDNTRLDLLLEKQLTAQLDTHLAKVA